MLHKNKICSDQNYRAEKEFVKKLACNPQKNCWKQDKIGAPPLPLAE